MRVASRSCSARCGPVPSTAAGPDGERLELARARVGPPRGTGRVTSMWNCRPQAAGPYAESLHAGGLWARRTAPGGRRQEKSCHSRTFIVGGMPVSSASWRPRRRARCAPADLARGHTLRALPPRSLGDELRAEAEAEHRDAARVGLGDRLALALDGASPPVPSVDDAAGARSARRTLAAGGSGAERLPGHGAHAEAVSGGSRAASGASRSCWMTSTVGFAFTSHLRPSAHRQRQLVEGMERCVRACWWRWDSSTSSRGSTIPGDPR